MLKKMTKRVLKTGIKHINKEKFEQAVDVYRDNAGSKCITCEKLDISRKTFDIWISTYPDLREKIEAVNESLIDHTESQLMELINGTKTIRSTRTVDDKGKILGTINVVETKNPPDNAAVIFFLKTKGKARGYIEKTEIEHTGDITVVLPKELRKDAKD